MPTTHPRLPAFREKLEAIGQGHVLAFADELEPPALDGLLAQIESVDWPEVARLIESHVKRKPAVKVPDRVEPAPYYALADANRPEMLEAREIGEKLLREGRVAAFTVAGGQGSRLGWDAPKGTFPASPIREAPLFAIFAEFLLKAGQKYGRPVPWYIMTSPVNDEPTRAFFEEHDWFGLHQDHIMFFHQGMLPAVDMASGKVLLASRDSLALSPNGHGGSLKALHTSGAIADMQDRGVTQISYFQVDNPNVKCVDPLFLGLHDRDGAQMSSKMLPKAYPTEKVGNFCLANGKMTVIEYSDLPEELAQARNADGSLRFAAGSIAIHAIAVDFVESLNTAGGFGLEYHRAEKKVPHLDPITGEPHEPRSPNAVKLETFVFDALPLCETSILLETDRVEEFAPIKNASGQGVKDSPETSKQLQSERAARWLEAKGVKVARSGKGSDASLDCTIELPHTVAIEPDDLDGLPLPGQIARGERLLVGG